jgi:hypothetical protein
MYVYVNFEMPKPIQQIQYYKIVSVNFEIPKPIQQIQSAEVTRCPGGSLGRSASQPPRSPRRIRPHQPQGPILQNFISAENFSDYFDYHI